MSLVSRFPDVQISSFLVFSRSVKNVIESRSGPLRVGLASITALDASLPVVIRSDGLVIVIDRTAPPSVCHSSGRYRLTDNGRSRARDSAVHHIANGAGLHVTGRLPRDRPTTLQAGRARDRLEIDQTVSALIS